MKINNTFYLFMDIFAKDLDTINKAINVVLKDNEKEILCLRYGLLKQSENNPKTLKEISVMYGVTSERIRQIEKKALIKLRRTLYIVLRVNNRWLE